MAGRGMMVQCEVRAALGRLLTLSTVAAGLLCRICMSMVGRGVVVQCGVRSCGGSSDCMHVNAADGDCICVRGLQSVRQACLPHRSWARYMTAQRLRALHCGTWQCMHTRWPGMQTMT